MLSPTDALFTAALGLAPPWYCKRSDFSSDKSRLDLWLDFPAGSRFVCPNCSAAGLPVHDTVEKEWRHMDFFQHVCFLHARVPRVRCEQCGVLQVHVPWARPGSGFTLLFEALVMSMSPHMPVAAITRQVREDSRSFFELPIVLAVQYLKRWYHWARSSRIDAMKKFALTIKRLWDGILSFHETKMTAGILEGINSLIQAAKRQTRGYRTTKNLITMIYLIAGKLAGLSANPLKIERDLIGFLLLIADGWFNVNLRQMVKVPASGRQ